MARGRNTIDIASTTRFSQTQLASFIVHTDEVHGEVPRTTAA
jgi:hypothetical protein